MDSLEMRIGDAFADERERRYGDTFVETVRQSWTAVEHEMRRWQRRMLVAAIAFELVTFGDVVDVSVAGVQFDDPSLLQLSLPVFVAYGYLELARGVDARDRYRRVHRGAMKILHPTLVAAKLEGVLGPGVDQPWETDPVIETNGTAGKMDRVVRMLVGKTSVVIAGMWPVLFLAHAVYTISDQPGDVVYALASLAVVAYLLLMSWLVLGTR